MSRELSKMLISKCGEATENNKSVSVFGVTQKLWGLWIIVATGAFKPVESCPHVTRTLERRRRITSRRRFSRRGEFSVESEFSAESEPFGVEAVRSEATTLHPGIQSHSDRCRCVACPDLSQRCNVKTQWGPKTAQLLTFKFSLT